MGRRSPSRGPFQAPIDYCPNTHSSSYRSIVPMNPYCPTLSARRVAHYSSLPQPSGLTVCEMQLSLGRGTRLQPRNRLESSDTCKDRRRHARRLADSSWRLSLAQSLHDLSIQFSRDSETTHGGGSAGSDSSWIAVVPFYIHAPIKEMREKALRWEERWWTARSQFRLKLAGDGIADIRITSREGKSIHH